MERYIILADVSCDISEEIRGYFGVSDYIEGHVHISDGRDLTTKLDWSEIGRNDFYKCLSSKKTEVSSAPASPEEYYEKFKSYAEEGYKILSMSISSKISSTYNVACMAAKRVCEEIEGAEIYTFDSERMSGAYGLLVAYAHKLKGDGRSYGEVIAWLEANKRRVHQMGPIDDLMFVARRGRITMGKAIMGSFAGVKPMGDCNSDGYVTVLGRAKGIGRALEITAKYVERTAVDIKDQYIIISHSDREAYAKKLAELIEALGPARVFVSDVFSASGTNVGPGMIGVYYLGEEISEGLSREREILTSLL